jgi:SSS family transporter
VNLAIGPFDAAVLLAYLVGMVLFGIWLGRGQRDVAAYLLGGRSLPWWAVLLSIVATETSTVTFLSIPGLAFNPHGGSLVFLQLTVGYIIGRLVIVFLFLPSYFRGELFTAYEVLQHRFGGATKQTASLLFLVSRNLSDGLRLFLTAIVLQQVLGLGLPVCIVVVGVSTIIYTWAGGMKSVVWNDCIQFAVYIAGAVLALVVILAMLGGEWTRLSEFFANLPRGWSRLADFARQHGKFRLVDLSFDLTTPYTLWSGLLGGTFIALATHGTDQLMVQRYLSARSQKEAGRALAVSGLVVCGQFALFLLIGVALACFYDSLSPDLEGAPRFARGDEVFPAFIVGHLPAGTVGIVVAAVFAAAMSTLSSSLNASAAAAVNDFYLPWRRGNASEKHLLGISRGLTIAFGLAQIGVAVGGQLLQRSVIENVMAIATFTMGVILGVFFLGVCTSRVTQRSALGGLVGGLAVMTAVVFRTDLAWPWYGVVGSSVTFIIGVTAHALLPGGRRRSYNAGDHGPGSQKAE